MTAYVAVMDDDTVWPGATSISLADIKDPTSATILLVELTGSDIHWMEPRDLHVDQMALTINNSSAKGISSRHIGGAQLLLVDGTARFYSDKTSPEQIHALLTRSGGEPVNDP